jgi:hypothetical protein
MTDMEAAMDRLKRERAARVAQVTRPRLEARVAAAWWAFKVAHPGRPDTGSGRNDGVMDVFAAMAGDSVRYPQQMIDCFEAELAAGIEAEIVRREENAALHGDKAAEWRWFVRVGTDYHPDGTLSDAAERAGMENYGNFVFPCKTDIYIDRGRITGSIGYGGSYDNVIWASGEGVHYWSNDALVECRDKVMRLGTGSSCHACALDAAQVAASLDGMRPPGYGEPYEPPRIEGDGSTYAEGAQLGLDLALALIGGAP